jgi:hypothetical protein
MVLRWLLMVENVFEYSNASPCFISFLYTGMPLSHLFRQSKLVPNPAMVEWGNDEPPL